MISVTEMPQGGRVDQMLHHCSENAMAALSSTDASSDSTTQQEDPEVQGVWSLGLIGSWAS